MKHQVLTTVIIRIILAFFILLILFYYFDPISVLSKEVETLNVVIFGIYIPLVFVSMTLVICIILAIPFWYISRLNKWWRERALLQVLLLIVGICLLSLPAFYGKSTLSDQSVKIQWNETMSLLGWSIVSFLVLTLDLSFFVKRIQKTFFRNDWTQEPRR